MIRGQLHIPSKERDQTQTINLSYTGKSYGHKNKSSLLQIHNSARVSPSPQEQRNYSHMEAINNIIIIKWMDESNEIDLVKTTIESGITTRSNGSRMRVMVVM